MTQENEQRFSRSIKQVLFLDIDGVLSRCEYGKDLYFDTYSDYCTALHRPSVLALKKLLEKYPQMKIVWISDWTANLYDGYFIDSTTSNVEENDFVSPLKVLELYPWIKERVHGILPKNVLSCNKLDNIAIFIDANDVESFAIVDDNGYDYKHVNDEHAWLLRHFVEINPLKSFLEDDSIRIEEVLNLPMYGKQIHSILLSMKPNDFFVVNDKYECRFDFSHISSNLTLFSKWVKCENSHSREECESRINVYDAENGKFLDGEIVLSTNKDLCKEVEFSATLYTKNHGASSWKSGMHIISMKNIARCI